MKINAEKDMVEEVVADTVYFIKKFGMTIFLLYINYYVFGINSNYIEDIPKKEILFDDEYVYFIIMSLTMLSYGIYQFFIKITTKISKFNNILLFIMFSWLLLITQRELILKYKAYEIKQNNVISDVFNEQYKKIKELENRILEIELKFKQKI